MRRPIDPLSSFFDAGNNAAGAWTALKQQRLTGTEGDDETGDEDDDV